MDKIIFRRNADRSVSVSRPAHPGTKEFAALPPHNAHDLFLDWIAEGPLVPRPDNERKEG